jgi:hypothetical protein
MTDAERELLLIVARWMLSQESLLLFDEADGLESDTKVKEAKDLAHHVRVQIAGEMLRQESALLRAHLLLIERRLLSRLGWVIVAVAGVLYGALRYTGDR